MPHCVQQVEVTSPKGLHAWPAQVIAKLANGFQSAVTIRTDDREINAKETLALLTLAAQQGTKLTISASGDDAEQAVATLVTFVESQFDKDVAEQLGVR
jgi:phosphotransferase system HPr (HPr) family protein